MSFPFISIIIPVYNVEAYLRECLDSIRVQENTNYEVILIDDGSQDSSPFICDEYAVANSQMKVIHKKNGGVGSARNVGLDVARGEWIWFVDADDIIQEHSLSIFTDMVKSYSCDTVFHGLINLYDAGLVREDQHVADVISDKETFLQNNFCFQNGMMLFHADIIRKNNIRFVEDVKMGEDLEFQYRYLMLCKKPIRIEGNYYFYRHREGSAISNPNTYINNLHNNISNVTSLLQFIKENNILPNYWIEKRIQLLLKASIQSALHVKSNDRNTLQRKLRVLVDTFKKYGFAGIEDSTLRLACFNLDIYLFVLNLFFKIKGIKY